MRIRRAIIIPAILVLGAAGSVLSGPAASAAPVHGPAIHAPFTVYRSGTAVLYHD
jgi:hypothetical protein